MSSSWNVGGLILLAHFHEILNKFVTDVRTAYWGKRDDRLIMECVSPPPAGGGLRSQGTLLSCARDRGEGSVSLQDPGPGKSESRPKTARGMVTLAAPDPEALFLFYLCSVQTVPVRSFRGGRL